MKQTILLVIVFVGLLLCSVAFSDRHYRTDIGQEAPNMQFDNGSGKLKLSDLRGKYVLLNFWNSTNALSRRDANIYTAWTRSHPRAALDLVCVNFDDNPGLFDEIVRRDGLNPEDQYRVTGDTAKAVVNTYGLQKGYGSLLIDPEGKIIAHNPSESQLSALVR